MWDWLKYIARRGFWAPILVLVVDMFLDHTFDIYTKYPSYDIISHTFGGAAIAYLFSVAYKAPNARKFIGSHSRFSYFLFNLSFCALVCIAWEFFEWSSDHYYGSRHQLSLDDTMGDFFFGLLGAGIVAILKSGGMKTLK